MTKITDYYKYNTFRVGHKETLEFIESNYHAYDVFLVVAPTGCHGKGQGVLMFDLSHKAIEDVQVGDLLMGPDGTSREVVQLHTGMKALRKIIPTRGNTYIVTHDHTLSTKRYKEVYNQGKKSIIIITDEITPDGFMQLAPSTQRLHTLWTPDLLTFEKNEYKELPIDPYFLGLWLGDGTSRTLSFTSMDVALIEYWSSFATNELQVRIEELPDNKANTYHITNPTRAGNRLWKVFTDLNLKENKHIPNIYFTSSVEQRRELLAALIDTDGHIDKAKGGGCCEIIQKRKELTDGIVKLARSLGFFVSVNEKYVKDVCYYRIHISGKLTTLPMKHPEKRAKARDTRANANKRRFIIEDAGYGEYFGVTVDKDNLYLLDDFTVTHNCGKTVLREAVAQYYKDAVQLAPTNQLVMQERLEYPEVRSMFGKETSYYRDGEFDYYEDLAEVRAAAQDGVPTLVTNYTLLAHRLQRANLLVDEGHNLLKFNADLSAKKLWRKKAGYPQNIYNREQLETWLRSDEAKARLSDKGRVGWLKKLETNDFMVERGRDFLNGKAEDVIKLVPISPGLHGAFKRGLKKLFLFSATIHEMDVEDLRVGKGGRVVTIKLPSPIPKDRRPIIFDSVGGINYYNLKEKCRSIASKLKTLADKNTDSLGLAHVTYGMIPYLEECLAGDPRFVFHNKTNSKDKLAEWQSGPMGKVFIAAGFSEGLDLKGARYKWQAICKIAWPSLADKAIKKRADRSERWYIWQTLRDFYQRYGRICRDASDYGETYIFDGTFERLHKDAIRFELWHNYMPEIRHTFCKGSFRRII